jgi:uncharacterized protein YfbU (UPF0304 family)
MELNIKERLSLSFQLKILEKLYPEEQEYYANHRKAIEDGYELHYSWITENLSEGLTSEQCTFVLDVLEMYAALHFSFRQLKESTKLSDKSVKFPGFDGNNETMYMAYTKYFIEDLDRFNEIRETTNGYYNSHSRMIPKYKKMLELWKAIKKPFTYEITEDQILELININGY